MIDAARSAISATKGNEQTALAADRVRALGLVKCLEIVGEAAGQLGADLRERHLAIPWGQIIGMRNRLVHAYFDIDYEQVWKALKEDLPPLSNNGSGFWPTNRGADSATIFNRLALA